MIFIKIGVKEMLYGALLTSLALLIPLVFRGWLQIYVPPFSATVGSHVPTMLAMFISPWVAVFVGLGSTLGFLLTLGPVIAARASIHIGLGLIGALLFRRGFKPWQVLLLTAPIHAAGESLVVMPFGFALYQALVVVGIGTLLHHALDSGVSLVLYAALDKAGMPLGNLIQKGPSQPLPLQTGRSKI